jgi:hypothetical protein
MNRLRLHVKRRAQPFGEIFCGTRDGASERRNEIVTGFLEKNLLLWVKWIARKRARVTK